MNPYSQYDDQGQYVGDNRDLGTTNITDGVARSNRGRVVYQQYAFPSSRVTSFGHTIPWSQQTHVALDPHAYDVSRPSGAPLPFQPSAQEQAWSQFAQNVHSTGASWAGNTAGDIQVHCASYEQSCSRPDAQPQSLNLVPLDSRPPYQDRPRSPADVQHRGFFQSSMSQAPAGGDYAPEELHASLGRDLSTGHATTEDWPGNRQPHAQAATLPGYIPTQADGPAEEADPWEKAWIAWDALYPILRLSCQVHTAHFLLCGVKRTETGSSSTRDKEAYALQAQEAWNKKPLLLLPTEDSTSEYSRRVTRGDELRRALLSNNLLEAETMYKERNRDLSNLPRQATAPGTLYNAGQQLLDSDNNERLKAQRTLRILLDNLSSRGQELSSCGYENLLLPKMKDLRAALNKVGSKRGRPSGSAKVEKTKTGGSAQSSKKRTGRHKNIHKETK